MKKITKILIDLFLHVILLPLLCMFVILCLIAAVISFTEWTNHFYWNLADWNEESRLISLLGLLFIQACGIGAVYQKYKGEQSEN